MAGSVGSGAVAGWAGSGADSVAGAVFLAPGRLAPAAMPSPLTGGAGAAAAAGACDAGGDAGAAGVAALVSVVALSLI
ncbi:hypothetical protein, partial [Mycobacteroides abscessus]|uniref:hypothetical protein n=1 Tax=Mycobacteroides abscessus TaxID=36809 RepID=UPI003C769F9A